MWPWTLECRSTERPWSIVQLWLFEWANHTLVKFRFKRRFTDQRLPKALYSIDWSSHYYDPAFNLLYLCCQICEIMFHVAKHPGTPRGEMTRPQQIRGKQSNFLYYSFICTTYSSGVSWTTGLIIKTIFDLLKTLFICLDQGLDLDPL